MTAQSRISSCRDYSKALFKCVLAFLREVTSVGQLVSGLVGWSVNQEVHPSVGHAKV